MCIELGTTSAVAESSADLEAVLEHLVAGRPIDAVLSRRVQERSERMTEELRRKYGELNVAVDLVREIRNEQ
jgi:hypothetical protein